MAQAIKKQSNKNMILSLITQLIANIYVGSAVAPYPTKEGSDEFYRKHKESRKKFGNIPAAIKELSRDNNTGSPSHPS